MRSKAHRYGAYIGAATFTHNTDVVGVTGDFEGGFVQASTFMNGVLAVGQYMGASFKVDGVVQGPQMAIYQSGSSVSVAYTTTLRVPQGRHRVSVLFQTNATPVANCAVDLSVAELNA